MSLSSDRPRKVSLAEKLQKLCGVAPEDRVLYRGRHDIVDPLYHLCTEVLGRVGRQRVKFFLSPALKPRFSAILVHPEKASTVLEEALEAAKEIYGECEIAVVFGEEVGGQFVYTNAPFENRQMEARVGVLKFNYRRTERCVMSLKSYLIGLGAMEDPES
jgi:hypothetical protein